MTFKLSVCVTNQSIVDIYFCHHVIFPITWIFSLSINFNLNPMYAVLYCIPINRVAPIIVLANVMEYIWGWPVKIKSACMCIHKKLPIKIPFVHLYNYRIGVL